MAQCKLSPREFIVNAFSPQIAAVCSSNAEATCQKNNLSFIQLLQPFCRINAEGHIKDPQGSSITVRSLQISVKDVNACPAEPTLARKILSESVGSSYCDRTTSIDIGKCKIDIPVAVPWFEAWREAFLNTQFPSDHEFTKHFLACMIVVSTADDDPKEKIQQIGAQLNQNISGKLPKWFNNNTLRYYILIHDATQDDKKKAEDVFLDIKNIYGGNNCFLLQMNSRPLGQMDDNTHLPDPWSQFISKHIDTVSSEQSSSPRTPADTAGVSAMPNQVVTESDKSSNAGTPIAPRNPILSSPDTADVISISSDISDLINSNQLEIGQEAVPIAVHPLSPEGETFPSLNNVDSRSHFVENSSSPINANVWADSPNFIASQHGARLSREDLEKLRQMMTEFCLKSLLPYVEKQIILLNDVISNKKSMSRSLFSAPKRWFSTSKPGVPGSTPTNAVIYTLDSAELQLRRLGDLCFMFGHYALAYQAYHNAKRDFASDQAWVYYAGALEMAALSAFMMDEVTRKTIEYMDDAIVTYLNTCKMPQFATRATLLSAECLKNRGLYGEAAKQLIRMTSEDSDLNSALLLEQAAYCFIGPKMARKYAFHAVLAGHRFSKAGQKKHSLRCYQQAHQVYNNKGWSLAEDHIYFIIGRQAASLKQIKEASEAFEKLLNASSKQPALQQSAFLREFLYIHNQLSDDSKSGMPTLPLPLIDGNQIKVLLGPTNKFTDDAELVNRIFSLSDDSDIARWHKMEQLLFTKAQGNGPMIFRPSVTLLSDTSDNSQMTAKAITGEPVYYSIELRNPLQISLTLTDVTLLWSHESDSNQEIQEDERETKCEDVECNRIDSMVLPSMSKQRILLSLVPRKIGYVKVLGIAYYLSSSYQNTSGTLLSSTEQMATPSAVRGKNLFHIKGKRLRYTKESKKEDLYGKDFRLEMKVFQKAPFIKIIFSKLSPEMLCGEIQSVEVELQNVGNAPLTNIHVATTNPQLFSLQNTEIEFNESQTSKHNDFVTKLPLKNNDILQVGEIHKTKFFVRAPHKKGNHRLDLLLYYENPDSKSVPRYRVARHTWHLTVMDSIHISAITRRSAKSYDNCPTLNLTVHIKNTNQVHDPSVNVIEITNIGLLSPMWSLSNLINLEFVAKIQPQEMVHFLLKLQRDNTSSNKLSEIKLCEDNGINAPYTDFVQKRNAQALERQNYESQIGMKSILENKKNNNNKIAMTLKLEATLVLRWRVCVVEGGTVSRVAIGQHHIDLEALNKPYNHPNEIRNDQIEYNGPLKIFGPDVNIEDRKMISKKEDYTEADYLKNLITYRLEHPVSQKHDFSKSRTCIILVGLTLQNNSGSAVIAKVDTVGTSNQMNLSSIRTQYSSQASTFFRYVGHTAIKCEIAPFDSQTVKLNVALPTSGTYDLASRLSVSVKPEGKSDFIPQEWRIESVCIINDSKPSK